jgi:hypothetical protein
MRLCSKCIVEWNLDILICIMFPFEFSDFKISCAQNLCYLSMLPASPREWGLSMAVCYIYLTCYLRFLWSLPQLGLALKCKTQFMVKTIISWLDVRLAEWLACLFSPDNNLTSVLYVVYTRWQDFFNKILKWNVKVETSKWCHDNIRL